MRPASRVSLVLSNSQSALRHSPSDILPPVTYNFNVDRWFETQKALLDARLQRGELDAEGYRLALEDIGRRADEMLNRLDGTFQIPGHPGSEPPAH